MTSISRQQTFHDIAQLPDIAGPGIIGQHLDVLLGEPDRPVIPFRKNLQVVAAQKVNVLLALPQRHIDGDHVEPIVEVVAEGAAGNLLR